MDDRPGEQKGPAVLFVCMANICRSPMAEALFRARLRQVDPQGWQNWRVSSAGTWAVDGEEAARNSQRAMEKRGLDITAHRSRNIDTKMIDDSDLILTMEPGQKESLCIEFPAAAGRIFLLSEMEGSLSPVSDPYGGSFSDYDKTAERIDQILARGMERIITLASRQP